MNKTAVAAPFSSVGGSTAVSQRERERLTSPQPSDFRLQGLPAERKCVAVRASADQYAGLPFLARRYLKREHFFISSTYKNCFCSCSSAWCACNPDVGKEMNHTPLCNMSVQARIRHLPLCDVVVYLQRPCRDQHKSILPVPSTRGSPARQLVSVRSMQMPRAGEGMREGRHAATR